MKKIGFYRSILVGFVAPWLLPEEYYATIMLKWHELK